jgi:formamidopyrimidine-DNA glycosylase
MPELAEVHFFRRQWEPGLRHNITGVDLHPEKRVFRNTVPAELSETLTGLTLKRSHQHGKQMLFEFSRDAWLLIRLGMSGELLCCEPDYEPAKHDHLVLRQKERALVFTCRRMFGEAQIHRSNGFPKFWRDLPPAILSKKFSRERFESILRDHVGRNLKALLLDQESFPGIGNWMADEILWQARIDPHRRPADLSEDERGKLYRKVRHVCRVALQTVGIRHGNPPDGWLFTHRWKKGESCPKTRKPLEREQIGGRTTAWSPAWQR